ncbi:aminotransferase class I/II-fold pyridoxal phosphate-dependent enzyme [Bacillus sp. MRMR6]|uniref:aminotransferase class I/II-fold pyridoxal phosphate-dependent enzyme n=1 Tax=Bacillus sp. MRMR6 TaxID=1928617 RepID=UPI00095255C3|nr:aminotransferase class I/II-fold pyridoxal phosphate-dependent enzyme [Bacillus sp. MRMR6]OLS34167.1 arginine decarboxylase [Bacillus sp. MRMR6]
MKNQNRMPIFEALIKHRNSRPTSFHVPGHKYGVLLQHRPEEENYFKDVLKIDATEITGLDDLHSPDGIIQEAEELLAELYQVKKSFFLINGSTVGNLAMIMAACEQDDLILVQRNCHKSVLNALNLAKVRPVFLDPDFVHHWKIASGVSLDTVEQAFSRFPSAKAIILTYPNYYGLVSDLKEISKLAHLYNIPVLVDEAHGSHLIVGEPFPASAIQCGADVVVQSAHKTLPAMTMGSYMHVNSDLVSIDKIREYLQMFQSSSPSYPIMASLDLARHYLSSYKKADCDFLNKEIARFKKELAVIPSIEVLDFPSKIGDLLKITIQSKSGLSGFELQKLLEKEGIYTELADSYNVLFIFPLLKENHVYPIDETIMKIKRVLADIKIEHVREEMVMTIDTRISELAIPFSEMAKYETKEVPIDEAEGKVCAETIIPYPPGIPLLQRGEQITEEKIIHLNRLVGGGSRFHGGLLLDKGLLKVFIETTAFGG